MFLFLWLITIIVSFFIARDTFKFEDAQKSSGYKNRFSEEQTKIRDEVNLVVITCIFILVPPFLNILIQLCVNISSKFRFGKMNVGSIVDKMFFIKKNKGDE